MSSEPPSVHSTEPAARALWSAKAALKRVGIDDWARTTVALLARPTYKSTLRAIPNREELPRVLNARRLTGTAVEVGVATGTFSEHMLTHWHGDRLISVDPWLEMSAEEYVDACNIPQESMEASYRLTQQRLARFGDRSEIWRQTGRDAASRVSARSLDFVYIDGRHNYEGVREDLEDWWPLIRQGGMMAGHDYNDGLFAEGLHGVKTAVDEFFGSRRMPVMHTHTDTPSISWLVFKRQTTE
jgi:predicted O-methyltransferase YrrM